MPASRRAQALYGRLVRWHIAPEAEEQIAKGKELANAIPGYVFIERSGKYLKDAQTNGLQSLAMTKDRPGELTTHITHQWEKGRKSEANAWGVPLGSGERPLLYTALIDGINAAAASAQAVLENIQAGLLTDDLPQQLADEVRDELCADRTERLRLEMALVRQYVSAFCIYYAARTPVRPQENG